MTAWRVLPEPILQPTLFGLSADQRSIELIRNPYGVNADTHQLPWQKEPYWLAFSGGKDSIVLMDLSKRAGVPFEAHYAVTTIDPPELVRFIKDHHPDVAFDHPEKSFWEWLPYHGVPFRNARWCCRELKERGGVNRTVLTGIRAQESSRRAKRGVINVCSKPGKQKVMVNPLYHWTHDEVWAYIRARQLPYCSLYDEGWKRLGCVFCPFESKRALVKQRWPKMWNALLHNVRKSWATWQTRPSWQDEGRRDKWATPEEFLAWWWDNKSPERDCEEQECFVFDQFGDEP